MGVGGWFDGEGRALPKWAMRRSLSTVAHHLRPKSSLSVQSWRSTFQIVVTSHVGAMHYDACQAQFNYSLSLIGNCAFQASGRFKVPPPSEEGHPKVRWGVSITIPSFP